MTSLEFLESRVLFADMVIQWNDVAIDVLRADTTLPGPGWSSRALAIMHGAVFDAVNGIDRSYRSLEVRLPAPRWTNVDAAIASAAHRVLVRLYPDQRDMLDDQLEQSLASVPNGFGELVGVIYGRFVANAMLRERRNDGSDESIDWPVNHEPGHWEPDPMNPTQTAWGPLWGEIDPFVLDSGDQFEVPPPPDMTSDQYRDAYNEVKELGEINSTSRTPDQTEIGNFWAYDRAGTGTPPALYNQIVQVIAEQEGNTIVENARLFALANLAMADAGFASWDCKYLYDFWRPITAIRRGGEDGNPQTEADADWQPLGAPGNGGSIPNFTPPFPAYVSGHATFGAAAFRVLEKFYGTDNMDFTLGSDEVPGAQRSYTSFSQASEENARSRIYLGIHWNFDDSEGRALGNEVADFFFDNAAQPRRNPGFNGSRSFGGFGALSAGQSSSPGTRLIDDFHDAHGVHDVHHREASGNLV